MKKALYLLIIGILLLPIFVKANGWGPLLSSYKAYVSNVNGITLEVEGSFREPIKVPFETVLEVYNEVEVNGILYAEVSYNDYEYYCKVSDLRVVNEKVDLKDFYKEEKPAKLYVYKKGAYLYKGPSKIYGKVSEEQIPVGTILTYEYHDSWFAYVTYNGKSGWVFTYPFPGGRDEIEFVQIENAYKEDASVAKISDYEYVFSTPNTELFDSNWKELKVSLKPLTKLKLNYYLDGLFDECYNVTYNEITSWTCIYEGELGQLLFPNLTNKTIYVASDTKFYKNVIKNAEYDSFEDNGVFKLKDEIGVIPKNTEVQLKYFGELFYVLYDGKEGYIDFNGNFAVSRDDDDGDNFITPKKDISLYDKIDGNKTEHFLKTGKKYKCKYHFDNWIYIETKEISGWVNREELKTDDDENTEKVDPDIVILPKPTPAKRNESLKKTLSRSSVIIISLLVATIVSASALTAIIFINKGRNNKTKKRRKQKNS